MDSSMTTVDPFAVRGSGYSDATEPESDALNAGTAMSTYDAAGASAPPSNLVNGYGVESNQVVLRTDPSAQQVPVDAPQQQPVAAGYNPSDGGFVPNGGFQNTLDPGFAGQPVVGLDARVGGGMEQASQIRLPAALSNTDHPHVNVSCFDRIRASKWQGVGYKRELWYVLFALTVIVVFYQIVWAFREYDTLNIIFTLVVVAPVTFYVLHVICRVMVENYMAVVTTPHLLQQLIVEQRRTRQLLERMNVPNGTPLQ